MRKVYLWVAVLVTALASCTQNNHQNDQDVDSTEQKSELQQKVDEYATYRLTSDVSQLTEKEKQMLPLLFQVAKIMDEIFWLQSYGDPKQLDTLTDPAARAFVKINYGPWDRLNNNEPFLPGVGEKPMTANFYPHDMTEEEFEKFESDDKKSLYTLVVRNTAGQLETVPYRVAYKAQIEKAADLLKQASALAEDEGLKKYLELRAEALLTDEYFDSDIAWMSMKTNTIDFVVGPIENYEDKLFNYKAAHEAYILIKDKTWSQRLAKYAELLPELQAGLPVADAYKKESPGTDSELNAYDVVYYAGDCNAGSKTIAINLPNDDSVQLLKGSRRLQLKNAMQAKFDKIMLPIAEELITPEQRAHVTFDAFFGNTMFHEVAHGLGVKNTINGKGSVSGALKANSTIFEEGKADVVGLYMVTKLIEKGELEGDVKDYYVTFMAGIFRSIRFGGASSHGQANLLRFNYFKEKEAFTQNADGTYSVNFDKFEEAINSLSELILTIQGDGDYDASVALLKEKAVIDASLQASLDRLSDKNIPKDIIFEQGADVLGLE